MLLGRYETDTTGQVVPEDWQDNLIQVLNTAYADKISENDRFFDVYGRIFEKEFVVIVSYMDLRDTLAAPISVFLSHDIIENNKQMKAALKDAIDFVGLIFDDIFATSDWNDYNPNWTENKYKEHLFHYKITRENISLTLQAEEILRKNIDL